MKFILIALFLLIGKNAFAQNEIWCDIAKEEMRVVQQQKSSGFKINDTVAFTQNSQSPKFRAFKMRVARHIYTAADSGAAYLNSRQYLLDCISAFD